MMKCSLLCVFIILNLVSFNLYAQKNIDSIKTEFQTAKNLSDKTVEALKIASKYRNVDNDSALCYVNKSISLASADNHLINLAHGYELKGSILTGMGQTKDALEILFGAVQLYQSVDSVNEISTTYNTIGNAYLDLEDIDKCKKYYQLSYDYAVKTLDTAHIAVPLVGLGIAYSEVGEFKEALTYSLKAAEMFDALKRMDAYCISLANSSSYANSLGKNELRDSLMHQAKMAAEKIDSKYFKAEILLMESEWLADEGNYSKAIKYAEDGILLMKEIDAQSNISNALFYLANYYAEANLHKEAFEILKTHLELKDSLTTQNKLEIVEELNTQYETAEKEKEIVLLNTEKNLQSIENKKNRTILYIVVFCSVFILLLAIYAFWAFIQKKKSNQLLQDQKNIIEIKNREILDSIQYAKRIQNAIIPSPDMIAQNLKQSFVIYQPKDIVAGDFYWMETVEDCVLIAVADCTGHGVPGAMVSVVCHNALNRAVKEFGLKSPAAILDKTRELVVETFSKNNQEVKDGMDITLCSWNQSDNSVEWSGANNPLYIIRQNNANNVEIIAPDKQPIGSFEKTTNFTNHQLSLESGDKFYLFSDGMMDQFGGENGKKYKYSNFRKLLLKIAKQPMDVQGETIFNEFYRWKGDLEQLDDVCIIGVGV